VQILGEPKQWVETSRYLGVALAAQRIWSAHVNQLWQRSLRIGRDLLSPLQKKRVFVRHCVLLHKQLIGSVIDYTYSILRSAALSHVQERLLLIEMSSYGDWRTLVRS
jgi:hypothetical protein